MISERGGAESGALRAQLVRTDRDLLTVVEAWPELHDAVRAGIMAMVRESC
jgi:hypothetical protein